MSLIKQIVLMFLFCLTPYAVNAEIDKDKDKEGILHPKGLLWKIEKPGQPASHVFGTMHVGDSAVVNLAPEVEYAFRNADRFAMEMLLTLAAEGKINRGSFFNDGRTLKSVMQADDYRKLLDLLNRRLFISESMVVNMRPWVILVMLMMPQPSEEAKGVPLDMMLYRRASVRDIPLLGLETPEEQLAVFESVDIDDQVWMLNRSVEEFNELGGQLSLMLKAYINRDLAALVKLQNKYMYDDSDIDDRFMYELIDKRNTRMVERMQNYLQKGNAFIAIGALHLPGAHGVLHLLEQKGYKVSDVY